MSPVWNKCNLLFIYSAVPSLKLFSMGWRMSDSNITPSFHIESLLCKYGVVCLSSILLFDSTMVLMSKWYMCFILFFVLVFVLCHMFCLKGGGLTLRLCNHGKFSFHKGVVKGGVGMCLLISVKLFIPSFCVICVFLMCRFKNPWVLKMFLDEQCLQGCRLFSAHHISGIL